MSYRVRLIVEAYQEGTGGGWEQSEDYPPIELQTFNHLSDAVIYWEYFGKMAQYIKEAGGAAYRAWRR